MLPFLTIFAPYAILLIAFFNQKRYGSESMCRHCQAISNCIENYIKINFLHAKIVSAIIKNYEIVSNSDAI
jgi:hypothetical protein